jgi:hypothetical protein
MKLRHEWGTRLMGFAVDDLKPYPNYGDDQECGEIHSKEDGGTAAQEDHPHGEEE